MKKIENVYQFSTLTEIVNFLKNNPNNTHKVRYREEGVLRYSEFGNYFYLDEYPHNSKEKCPVIDLRGFDYFDKATGKPIDANFARDYKLTDFRGIETVTDAEDGAYVLRVVDEDIDEISVHLCRESALGVVKGDLSDRNHFDTDEPYCTAEELAELQATAVNSLLKDGVYDDGEVKYTLEYKPYEG